MKKKFLLLFLLAAVSTNAQYKESTPWMKNLKKDSKIGKTKNQEETNYSIYQIRESFDKYWATSGKDSNAKGSGFKQFKRWENYWKHLVDAKGMLPSPKSMWDSFIRKERGVGATNPVADWSPLGPNRPGVLSGSLPGTGRINTVIVDPNNPNIWYAGAPAGGIWKSVDAGENWVSLFDNFPQIGVSGIAVDPTDSNIVYIATGDDDAGDTFSAGVFKSLDGGQTWNETGLNPSNSNVGLLMNEIFINPSNTDIVFVGTNQGLFRTTDGGVTFESVLTGNINDFRLKPNDPNIIYAVTSNRYFKSSDGGNSFDNISDILPNNAGRTVIEVTEANSEVLYIMMAESFQNDGGFLGLFKSTDSGETFEASPNTTNIFEANQTFFNLALEVSPTDENLLFTGALNIWRSTNGGNAFNQINQWFINNDRYTHADIHFIRYFGDTLFAGTDGGLYISEDEGTTFQDKTGNMEVTQFYRIDVAETSSERIAGGTQDNAGFVLNNGEWNVYTGGDGMDYEIDPNNPDLIYGFVQFGQVMFITTNAGQTVGQVAAPRNDQNQTIRGNWITPLATASDGTVYSGYDAVYRLNGNAWERVSANIGSSPIDDLEIDPNNPDIIYAAQENIIHRSTNGGQTFIPLQAGLNAEISAVEINKNDSNVLYVTTSLRVGRSQAEQEQVAERGVYRIEIGDNNAVTVSDITLNLPTDQAFFSIASQGRDTNNPIYVGTNLGVYRLDDTLTEWEEFFTGLPNTPAGDLEVSLADEVLIAATYGRGIWKSPIPIQVPDNDVALASIEFPNSNSILCGEVIPSVIIESNGSNVISEADITYVLNGGSPVTETVSLNLASRGEQQTIQLTNLNIQEIGENTLEVTVNIPNDAFSDNNTISITFFSNDFGFGNALNTFENSAEDALLSFNENDGSNSVWEIGEPSGSLLGAAASGSQAYGTNLDGNHPDNTKGFLVSKCYELSNILSPVLKFNMAFDLEQNFDIVFVEYSTNNGVSWDLLGSIDSQPNWYNSNRTNASSGTDDDCQNCPGGQWTGTSSDFIEYAYDFNQNAALGEPNLTSESNVIFRIVFQSDPSVTQEGVVIDDFVVEGVQDDDDDDNDGVLDVDDNCPLLGNANQLDTDNDGMGDVCDDDDDDDGILDMEDNCPLTPNPDQADSDMDGIGDVCDNDSDNDGVPNDEDLCPSTLAGAVVDIDGCEVFSLPPTNFRILTTGESCISSNNGMISITAERALEYSATLTGNGENTSADFNSDTIFENLGAGSYTLCIRVQGQADYEFCSELQITEPEPLAVSSFVNGVDRELTLRLDGASTFIIELNDETFTTSNSEIVLPLKNIQNTLTVKTSLACQGIFSQTILINTETFIYPNPVNSNGDFSIVLGNNSAPTAEMEVSIFSINGVQIMNKRIRPENGKISLNISGFTNGIYLVNVQTDEQLLNYKILKR